MDKIDHQFEKIEEKLRKSFLGIKQDISNLNENIKKISKNSEKTKANFESDKESLKQEIKQLKDKKEKSSQKDTEKLEKNILDLTNYVSGLKKNITDLKDNQDKQSDVKNLIEFNELKSQISDLKDSIDNIKFPEQKDNSKEFFEISKKLGAEIETLRKEVKAIKIPAQKDYSGDLNELAKEIGEIKGLRINKKYLDKEISRTKQDINDKIGELEEKQQELENSIEQKTKSPLVFSLKNEVKSLRNQIEQETEKYEGFLSKIKEENRKLREEVKSENEEMRNQLAVMKGRITRLSSTTPEKEEIIEREPFEWPKINKNFLIMFFSILVVAIILLGIMFFVNPTIKAKYEPLDIVAKNITGLPMTIYLHQNPIFTISGWESKISYANNIDRITGKNNTGWFLEEPIIINESKMESNRYVSIRISNESKAITETQFDYTFFKDKPYFKIQLSAFAVNNSKLGPAQYGFVIKGYDVYLSNGTILKNDNNVTDLNETTSRDGSVYPIDSANYEVFFNSNSSNAIILYSKDNSTFINNFYWNVFLVYENLKGNGYSPVYIMVLEKTQLNFIDEKWRITSKEYSGDLEQYINKSVLAMS